MEILIIVILTLLNGFFALTEIALVSVKKRRMEHLAAKGNRRAETVLNLLRNPENFLSSVQVGITLIGIVAGAYGGATLTDDMESILLAAGFPSQYATIISVIIVIGAITYFTIVVGELVPKSLALSNSEKIALTFAPVVRYFTIVVFPIVRILSFSTRVVLKIAGVKEEKAERISEEELIYMLTTAGKQGVLEKEESEIHRNLFSFTDQTARSLVTPRAAVEWINTLDSKEITASKLEQSTHSKFIVAEGSLDNIKGIVSIKDFLENYHRSDFDLAQIIRKPLLLPQGMSTFKILNLFRDNKQYLAIVVDNRGRMVGIITVHDLFEALIGYLPDEARVTDTAFFRRDEHSVLIDGEMPIDRINSYFEETVIPTDALGDTISDYLVNSLNATPKTGEKVAAGKYEFEIVDMDGQKIDKVLITHPPTN